MYLKEYINKIKEDMSYFDNKSWLDSSDLVAHVDGEIPDSKTEEWKNFKTINLKKINWKIPNSETHSDINIDNNIKKASNSILFIDGQYDSKNSNLKIGTGVNVFNMEDYIKDNPEIKKLLYSKSEKYAENRLSGILDKKPAYFISLNSILSSGTVIEIEKEKKISDLINIVHAFSKGNHESLINPYVVIICKSGSEASFQEVFLNMNYWVNNLTEVFIEPKAKLVFSRLQTKMYKGIKTSSFNCHLEENSSLNLKVINRERCKEDIRIFLNKDNSSVRVSGIILSNEQNESDVFCKVTHKGKLTYSDQKWRLISKEKSKTSINGKICVNKNAKGSDASFYSKSLILDEKSSSFSKPELEILEDDVKCKHGASFGEIDKNIIFYMQSRGIIKNDAIMLLVYAFIDEIGLGQKDFLNTGVEIVKDFFKETDKNE